MTPCWIRCVCSRCAGSAFCRGSAAAISGRKHGVDIIRVNGIVFDKTDGIYRRVSYKTDESLRFFVLHSAFRKWGFVDWAIEQGDNFLFRLLQTCKDPSDTASDRINKLLRRGGAAGMNIEVGQSLRHGGKAMRVGLTEVRLSRQSGPNLLNLSSSGFDPDVWTGCVSQ